MPKTIFVTGASGFIAQHIILQLLEAGYRVKGSVRSQEKAEAVRRSMQTHLSESADLDARLSCVDLDLTSDDGWDEALTGADALMHTASPFPMSQPKYEDDLINPAVEGTRRALRAATSAGISRVILTSSVASIFVQNPVPAHAIYTEEDWTDTASPAAYAYIKSKTLAEWAAWEYVRENPAIALTTINPSLVLGPALDRHFGTSLKVVQRILNGKDPAVPAYGMEIVDVRDIAAMHVAALSKPESEGKRFIGSSGFMWFRDMNVCLKSVYPERKISTLQAPNLFIRLFGLFDPAVRSITPMLGKELKTDNARAREVLGIDFIPARKSLKASAEYLIANDLVG